MFEFRYEVALSIMHPTANLEFITQALNVTPEVVATAGEELFYQAGKSRGRLAQLSCWIAPMHPEATIDSGERGLGEFLRECVERLGAHAALFHRINDEGGEVQFRIGCHCPEPYSTSVLTWSVLRCCAEIGIGLEIGIIVPTDQVSAANGIPVRQLNNWKPKG